MDTVNPVGIIIIFALIALFYLACMAVGKR